MSNELKEYLESLKPEVRELVLHTRELVRATVPKLQERVHLGYGSIMYGPEGVKMSEMACYISGQTKHVNLGFSNGANLPDPKGLLEGTGKAMRHVKIKKLEDLEKPGLIELLHAAEADRA